MRHFSEAPRLTLKEQVFHTGLTGDKNLATIFHELNPDVDDYLDLDYNVLDVEPVYSPKTGNSMSFIVSDENLNNKITLIVTTNTWDKKFFDFLLFAVVRYSLELSKKLQIRNPLDLNMDVCILYTGEADEMVLDTMWMTDQTLQEIKNTVQPQSERLTFRTLFFDSDEPGENELASIFYKYWRFTQIYTQNHKKYPTGFEGLRKTIKQCIDEDIFPELFKRRRRF